MTAATTVTTLIGAASSITSLVGTRYWPNQRQSDTLPSLTWETISEIRNDHITAPGKGKNCRIQFDCWATTRAGADALGDALEVLLSQTGYVVYRRDSFDQEVEIYRAQLDWSVRIDNPT